MNCEDVQLLLNACVDGEVDLVRNLQIEEHRASCERCEQHLKVLKELREVVAMNAPYFRSPPELRTKVRHAVLPARGRRHSSNAWAKIAAGIVLFIGIAGSAIAVLFWSRGRADDRLAELILSSHVRSLQVAHLIDVASTDRHTVKPWFVGKIDFAPEILDLSAPGFELAGGRLDYLDGHAVAAVVYRKRQHVINLFLWPEANAPANLLQRLTLQGFHLRHWQQAGITYWAISDLNEPELDQFVRLVQEHSSGL